MRDGGRDPKEAKGLKTDRAIPAARPRQRLRLESTELS